MAEPRGFRNNNPGNIKHSSIKWQGASEFQTDNTFVQFSHWFWGVRAIAVLLTSYQQKHNLRTPEQIFDRYAPSNENNTSAYAAFVASKMGVRPSDTVDLADWRVMLAMVKAIIAFENNGTIPFGEDQLILAVQAGMGLLDSTEAARRAKVLPTEAAPTVTTATTPTTQVSPEPPQPPQPKGDQPVIPIIPAVVSALVPTLIESLPSLARIITRQPDASGAKPSVAERNIELLTKVGEIVTKSTGEPTVEGAARKIASDPVVAKAVDQQIALSFTQLLDLMERADMLEQKSMSAATDRMLKIGDLPLPKAWPFVLVGLGQFALTFMVMTGLFWIVMKMVDRTLSDQPIPDLPSWVSTLIGGLFVAIALEWRSILQYVVGTTRDSAIKTQLIAASQPVKLKD